MIFDCINIPQSEIRDPHLLGAMRVVELIMPAIAPIEDLRAAQAELLAAKDIDELKKVFKKYRRIGWKNICKLWLRGTYHGKIKR